MANQLAGFFILLVIGLPILRAIPILLSFIWNNPGISFLCYLGTIGFLLIYNHHMHLDNQRYDEVIVRSRKEVAEVGARQ